GGDDIAAAASIPGTCATASTIFCASSVETAVVGLVALRSKSPRTTPSGRKPASEKSRCTNDPPRRDAAARSVTLTATCAGTIQLPTPFENADAAPCFIPNMGDTPLARTAGQTPAANADSTLTPA